MKRCILALSVFSCLAVMAPGFAADPAPRIAVLRLVPFFEQVQVYKTMQEGIKTDMVAAKERLQALEDEVRANENRLKSVQIGSAQAQQLADDLEKSKLERKQFLDRVRGDIERRQLTAIREVYKLIRSELAEFARAKGIVYVGAAPEPELLGSVLSDVQLQLNLQTVLYYDPSMDMTEEFLAYFNARAKLPSSASTAIAK